tara:strand:- start:309 stop:896 length:588 start_codon:yes stop_codon:yes gene_type:complete
MSAIKLIPASGGGSVSLAPPNSTSGSDVTITMPSTSQTLGGSAGKILQVVSAVKNDSASFSASWSPEREISSDLRAVITPAAASSKILVTCHLEVSQGSNLAAFQLSRTIGGTKTYIFKHTDSAHAYQGCANTWFNDNPYITHISFSYVDSPNTTSEITYSPEVGGCGVTLYINRIYNSTTHLGTSSTIAMEIGA